MIPYCRAFNVHLVIYYCSSLLNTFGMFIEHTKNIHIRMLNPISSRSQLVPCFRSVTLEKSELVIEPQTFGLLGRCSTIELFVPIKFNGAKRLESHTPLYKWEGYMNIRPTLKNWKIILRHYMRSRTLHEYTILQIRYMFGV